MEKPKLIYIDTSLLIGWFEKMMSDSKDKTDTDFVNFLKKHPEVTPVISIFTIAELVEHLLHKAKKIRRFKINKDFVLALADDLKNSLKMKIIEYEAEGEDIGIFIPPEVVDFTAVCGEVKDAVHACIAKHQNLTLVTHEDKFGKMKELYPNILTDRHLYKLF